MFHTWDDNILKPIQIFNPCANISNALEIVYIQRNFNFFFRNFFENKIVKILNFIKILENEKMIK